MTATAPSLPSKSLQNIQFLRFVAATIVVVAHVDLAVFAPELDPLLFQYGGIGVDIFFLISGYIMMYVTQDLKPDTKNAFLFFVKRVIRVVPLNIAFTLLSMAIAFWAIQSAVTNPVFLFHYPPIKIDYEYFIESITFTHLSRPAIHAISWTLQFEFIFYSLFAICIFMGADKLKFWLFYVALHTVYNFSMDLEPSSGKLALDLIFNPLMIEFVAGILLFYAISYGQRHTIRANLLVWMVASIALYAVCYFEPGYAFAVEYDRLYKYAIPAFILVSLFIIMEGRLQFHRSLLFLGDASYSIYLTHWTVVTVAVLFGPGFDAWYLNVVIIVAISIAASCAVHVWIERPMTKLLRPLPRLLIRA